jgi:predicted ATPase
VRRMGDIQAGLATLDQAFEFAEATNERFFEAELHRLRGTMLSALGKRSEAEAALRWALTLAGQQGARWWELRAATSLARHLGDGCSPSQFNSCRSATASQRSHPRARGALFRKVF